MIAIKNIKMPVNCEECFARVMMWCRLDEEERVVVPVIPCEQWELEERPEWCPLVDVPDMNVGNSSEIPNNSDCVSRQVAIDETKKCRFVVDAIEKIRGLPSVQPEKEIPKRVRWSGWKGTRYTRYYCPNCEKPVRNDDYYCHRCGQRLTFPKVTFTDYVPGKKQQTIITWEDEDE